MNASQLVAGVAALAFSFSIFAQDCANIVRSPVQIIAPLVVAKSIFELPGDLLVVTTEPKNSDDIPFADTATIIQKKYFPEVYAMVKRAKPKEVSIGVAESVDGNNSPALFLYVYVRRVSGGCFEGRIGSRIYPDRMDSEVPTNFLFPVREWGMNHP